MNFSDWKPAKVPPGFTETFRLSTVMLGLFLNVSGKEKHRAASFNGTRHPTHVETCCRSRISSRMLVLVFYSFGVLSVTNPEFA